MPQMHEYFSSPETQTELNPHIRDLSNTENGIRIKRMLRVFTEDIRVNQYHPCTPCAIQL